MLKMSASPPAVPLIVTVAFPRSPVKLTVSLTKAAAAVTVFVTTSERSAEGVSSSAVTATVPAPVASLPLICAAVMVSVWPETTTYSSTLTRLLLLVTSMLLLTVAVTPASGSTLLRLVSAPSARTEMAPPPLTAFAVT